MSTIYALSTVFGKSGVAVFRVSGPDALGVLEVLNLGVASVKPRSVHFAKLYEKDLLLDELLIIYFSAPASFTGEDVVEIHSHGSIAILRYITERLSQRFVLAEPGEFTRRAVLNNKMDLTKAEGIIDLINAETSAQLKQASRHISGHLEEEYDSIRMKAIRSLSHLEAYIDFPDEEIPVSVVDSVTRSVEELIGLISNHLDDGRVGEKIRKGFLITIIGKPNAGKSTLFNYLAKRELAIVTDIPGTTRDVLEVKLDCNGYPIVLLDTAGIQDTDDKIEKEGIAKAINSASDSDIVIFLRDISELHAPCSDADTSKLTELLEHIEARELPIIRVATKADDFSESSRYDVTNEYILLSVHKEKGVELLLDKIFSIISTVDRESYVITHQRHRVALEGALMHLRRFSFDLSIELAAEELKLAADYIGSVTGKIKLDEILDEIFSTFCIGK
ncbi:tRNA modification GTPase TrmE [Neorickettsia helminthoeca str. Oregon]|uniref:tRNA modification GTPase MnmE n=1 Tax=Neorickettsia helminthoeca str. Oregon TaxID=1286528 RepID=X5GX44_9RICK|nr:tRNA uridine-5-carboxymethylaminomethyl(34) synthesis GTPase MnmE [Neorickettsia helminthoeca]AHX11612.1 tRNA modification GTPase TrmE [Neorickettsia helminthoeca str. Oregon]